ncbi:uncharacterized protein LOC119167519 isoform X3 [Rhipicephalus microplus]|uniref:uncharacterized protein LOC119167519 isoform X3 n=1 Tax=Rhipicephalus microplus TaxID=6941 RepID=UPI003F6AFCF5
MRLTAHQAQAASVAAHRGGFFRGQEARRGGCPSRPSAKIRAAASQPGRRSRRSFNPRYVDLSTSSGPFHSSADRHMATQTAWPAKKDVAVQTVLADIVKMPRIAQDHKSRTRSRYRGSPRKELEPCQRCFALWGAPFENYGWADEVETIGTKQTFNVAASTNELQPYNILARHCRYIPRLSLPREHGNSRRPHHRRCSARPIVWGVRTRRHPRTGASGSQSTGNSTDEAAFFGGLTTVKGWHSSMPAVLPSQRCVTTAI